MSVHTSTRSCRRARRRTGGALVAAAALAVVSSSAPAIGVETSDADGPGSPASQWYTPCGIDPDLLPRTADAASGWLSTCYRRSQLPATADAITGWLH